MFNLSINIATAIILTALFSEYIDSSLGMGYGTILTPVLLLLGYSSNQVVPAVLVSEFATGLVAGVLHNHYGNVSFKMTTYKPKKIVAGIKKYGIKEAVKLGLSSNLKMMLLIALFSIVGVSFAASVAVELPKFYLTLFIGILICLSGVYILITMKQTKAFSWKRLSVVSIIASFNKGLSGGGYGPIVTGGQLLSGVDEKNAIAITSTAEGLTCIVGLLVYFIKDAEVDWLLAPYLTIGGLLAVPLSAITIKKLKKANLRIYIGITTILLGALMLYKLFK